MRVHRPFRSAKKPAGLVRRKIGHDLAPGHEFVANAFEAMRVHDRRHHLAIDGKRHIDPVTLDQRGPMLVAQRVAELDASAHRDLEGVSCSARRDGSTMTSRSADLRHDRATQPLDPRAERRRRAGRRRGRAKRRFRAPLAVFLRKRFFCASQWSSVEQVDAAGGQDARTIRRRPTLPRMLFDHDHGDLLS